jgi:hypothetical protein
LGTLRRAPQITIVALQLWAASASSQELEPRAFSPAPIGTKFFLTGFGTSEGAYAVDAAAPIQNVHAEVSFALAAGGYTFDIAGHQARLIAVLPFVWGGISGEVNTGIRSRALEGFGDPRFKFSVGLAGAPALALDEFVRATRSTAIGVSLTVMPPLGQYDPGRLVNLGFNRWAFKPEVGVWHPAGHWTLDGSAGIWLFTRNDAYFPGKAERTQDPIISVQGHISYDFDVGIWLALDAAWFAGGQTHVNGLANSDRQNSVRLGATLSLPVSDQQSLKITYSTGVATRRGSDFDTIVFTWQVVMF